MHERLTLVNGQRVNQIDADNRGLHYGDGLFETMAYAQNEVRLFDRHYRRMREGCQRLGMQAPREQDIKADIQAFKLGITKHTIKLIVTRAPGGFGYAPAEGILPTQRILQVLPWPSEVPDRSTGGSQDDSLGKLPDESSDTRQGLRVDVLKTVLGSSPMLAGLKHLNRLEQVMAARELQQRNLDEGLLCNQEGFLIEAVSSNVFCVFDGQIVTPKLDSAGVCGIAREVILQTAQEQGIDIGEEYIFGDAVQQADELILCNSIRGFRPVACLGERALSGRHGYRQLINLWRSAV